MKSYLINERRCQKWKKALVSFDQIFHSSSRNGKSYFNIDYTYKKSKISEKCIKCSMQHHIIFNWDSYFDKLLFTTCLWACGYKNLDLHEHARILFIFALYVQTHHVMIVSMWAPCLEPISVRRFSQSSNL